MKADMEHRGPFQVVGIRRTTPYGGGTWAIVKQDGSDAAVRALCGHSFDLGVCFGFGEDGNDYMCAVEWEGSADGFDAYRYPESAWLRFRARGRISEDALGAAWREINEDFFPQSRFVKCGARRLPTIERYVQWDEGADACDVEIWIPVDEKP